MNDSNCSSKGGAFQEWGELRISRVLTMDNSNGSSRGGAFEGRGELRARQDCEVPPATTLGRIHSLLDQLRLEWKTRRATAGRMYNPLRDPFVSTDDRGSSWIENSNCSSREATVQPRKELWARTACPVQPAATLRTSLSLLDQFRLECEMRRGTAGRIPNALLDPFVSRWAEGSLSMRNCNSSSKEGVFQEPGEGRSWQDSEARPGTALRSLSFLLGSVVLSSFFLFFAGCAGAPGQAAAGGKAVVVVGIDGLDWEFTQKMIAQGRMPRFAELARQGMAQPLGTSVPPLSPVAWSNFISGMDPGGHGIFDFMHCDREHMIPVFAMSEAVQAPPRFKLGKYVVPGSGEVTLLRRGPEFWDVLERAGVPAWIYRMPANFPPSGRASREISGMGTPDLLGTYGTFSFYTSALFFDDDVSGGEVYPLDLWEDRAEGALYGPDNPFLAERTPLSTPLAIYFDAEEPVAEIVVGEDEARVVLSVGEWSDWVPVAFPMVPTKSLPAAVRFYLRAVRPEVELYVTPLQIDPLSPALPISTPPDYAAELARATGRYYTQGIPEDTKIYTEEIFDRDEFLSQSRLAHGDLVRQFEHVLAEFRQGLLFYYFGDIDQVSHLFWGAMDPEHPTYDPAVDPRYAEVVPKLYQEADRLVGYALDHLPEGATLVVMSDHGFASWRRAFNLNSWLRDHGYLTVKNPTLAKDPGLFFNVDWSRTRAYGVGFNGLYLNVRGREKNGIVEAREGPALLEEIGEKLLATLDPKTGLAAVTRVYPTAEVFRPDQLALGPDMVVGYAEGTRAANAGVLGELTPEIITDNMGRWTGDHGMDHTAVPGVLYASRRLGRPVEGLEDLAAAVLAEFGVEAFPPAATPAP